MKILNKITFLKAWYFIPSILLFSFLFIYPIFNLIMTSFKRQLGGKISYVGFSNFGKVLSDSIFLDSIKNNLILIITVIPILVFICLIFSVLIYEQEKYSRFYQIIIFIPYILSITATGILFSYLLQPNGVINEVLRKMGLGFLAVDWFGNPKFAIFTIAIVIIWKEIGFGTILFISRLESLSQELIDAVKVDGANWWQILIHLYIPHLGGILVFYITLTLINMLSWVFNYVFVITGGGSNTSVFEFYIYLQYFIYQNKWVASAAAVMVSSIVIVLIFIQMRSRLGLSETKK